MMKKKIKIRGKTIAEQIAVIRSKYPSFSTTFTSRSSLKVAGTLKPTSRSTSYEFMLKYRLGDAPEIRIISPVLRKNDKGDEIPHLYPNEILCLYHPKYSEFCEADYLSDTIIPWASLWLYHYEVWHLTNEWLGGGVHPTKQKPYEKEK